MAFIGRLFGAAIAAVGARAAYAALTSSEVTSAPLQRTNHRGDEVTLAEGPALAIGALKGVIMTPGLGFPERCAASIAVTGSGALGAYDDLVGESDTKGLRGHLHAAKEGEITTGLVKLLGLGGVGVIAGTLARRGRGGVIDGVLAGVVVAGSANLLNLLDLRPGRAAKVFLATGTATSLAGGSASQMLAAPIGATSALVAEDLAGRSMMGDTGANAIGAVWGTAAVSGMSRHWLLVSASAITGLTLLSERVSFSQLIAGNPVLSWFDELGRPEPLSE